MQSGRVLGYTGTMDNVIDQLAALVGASWLPKTGHRFTYTLDGVSRGGVVVRSEADPLLPWEVLVHVRFEDGEEATFWNSSFIDSEALRLGESIVHHI